MSQERVVEVPVDRVVVQEKEVVVDRVVEKVVERVGVRGVPVERLVVRERAVEVEKVGSDAGMQRVSVSAV
jgi:hypothetical protein